MRQETAPSIAARIFLVFAMTGLAAGASAAQEPPTEEEAFLLPGEGEGFERTKQKYEGRTEVQVSGYFDLEFRDPEDRGRRFRAHRFVPLLEAQIDERIRFVAELEIEDGADLSIEFAHLDYELRPWLALRAGILLLPLGRLNLEHDSPIREFTDRPRVDRLVIPTTLRDAGIALRGRLPGDDEDLLRYELDLHGGFRGQVGGAYLIDRSSGLRSARPHTATAPLGAYEDNNSSTALSARFATEGAGYQLGLFGHHGAWDEKGELDLGVVGADASASLATLPWLENSVFADQELRVEGVIADVERDAAARAAGVPGSLGGWYAQWAWKIWFDEDVTGPESMLGHGAHVTMLLRHERVDLAGARLTRDVVGFNFRPNESRTVMKLEYQWNAEGGLAAGTRDDAFVASFATYF